MDEDICFTVEEVGSKRGMYRASLVGDQTTWGYGQTPYEAIANVCAEYDEIEGDVDE